MKGSVLTGIQPSHQGIVLGLWDGVTSQMRAWLRCDRYVEGDDFWMFTHLEDAIHWQRHKGCRIIEHRNVLAVTPFPRTSLHRMVALLCRLAVVHPYDLLTFNCQAYCRIVGSVFSHLNGIRWRHSGPRFTCTRLLTAALTLGYSEACVAFTVNAAVENQGRLASKG